MSSAIPSPHEPRAPRPRLPRSPREFLETESASGVVLVLATLAAIVWVSSPWSGSYASIWGTSIDLRVGESAFTITTHAVLSDALMALFFFLVGLEIKRELIHG